MKRPLPALLGMVAIGIAALVVGAGAAHADDPWPDPFVKSAGDAVVVLDDPWPDPF
ncbi:hypothetical protein [Streptosporangium sp. OZ121]|uniref:hypothetical protein n=1 Tax=Streptosporangium sp. OZ121 TaxID=3444183 RepID=UPI003F79E319